MNPRPAAAALLAGVLAVALPAAALVVPKFGGGKSAPPSADGGPLPHSAPASPDGGPLPHSTPGAAGQAGRVPHPELLRAAVEPAQETLRGRAHEEADAAAREQAVQAEPWAAAPHMRVHLAGDPVVDAKLLKWLNTELATPIDPDRLRVGTLADDALADDTLARLLARRPYPAQLGLWKFLRKQPPNLDLYHLTDALRPLKGDTLLVMGHIDARDGALVFKAANGAPVRLPVRMFEQAARDAGVQLVVVGCKSARYTGAGFVDDLNALDASRAIARAVQARPDTLFDLFNALSGPSMVMQFNAQTFWATHTVEVRARADGPAVSTLHWNGPQVQAAASAALAATTAPQQPGASAAAPWWSNPALPWLGAAALVSLLAGALVSGGTAERRGSMRGGLALEGLGHLLAMPVLVTLLAEAVAGPNGFWWAWICGPLLTVLALACVVVARADPAVREQQGLWFLRAARLAAAAVPLMAVALLHAGWLVLPVPLVQALLALYGLGRPLPEPGALFAGAMVLVWIGSGIMSGIEGLQNRRKRRLEGAGRMALWRQQLKADGVTGPAARAALASRQAFDRRCARPVERVARWDQVQSLADFHGPDPWAALTRRHWRVLAVPLVPRAEGADRQVGFGLLRVGSPFMHPLPQALLQRWRQQDLRESDLPLVLARVEPRLSWTDFVEREQLPRLTAVMLFGAAFSALFFGLALWMDPDSGERMFCAGTGAFLMSLLVLWPAAVWSRRRWQLRWLQRVRPASMASATPPTAAATG